MDTSEKSRPISPLSPYLWALGSVRWSVYGMLVLACLAALFELGPYLVAWRIMGTVLEPSDGDPSVLVLALAAVGLVVARFIAQGGTTVLGHRAAFLGEAQLRHRLLDHVAKLPLTSLEGRTGDLKRVLMDDVGRLNGLLAHVLPDVISGLLLPVVVLFVFAVIDWRMALAAGALLPVAFWVQARMASGSASVYQDWLAVEAKSGSALLAYVRGIATLRAFRRQASSLEDVRQSVHAVRDMAVYITRRSAFPYAVFGMTMSYPLAVVLPVGLFFTLNGDLAFQTYLLFLVLGGVVMAPLNRVVAALHSLRKLSASGDRIVSVLAQSPLPGPTSALSDTAFETSVRFENVGFSVSNGEQKISVLDDVSFTVPSGSVTMITGPSGAGKTTLARLLARMDDCSRGRITIAGVDVREMSEEALRQKVAIVFQDPVLFHATLRDNIRLARPDAPDGAVVAALHAAGAADLQTTLPDGLDTMIGDRGSRLSGGERQRIALARAFLKDAPILILDEATAHVDPLAEHEIRQALRGLMKGRTVLVIAHRLKDMDTADQVVVMRDGMLDAAGSHATVLEQSPTYASLWKTQHLAADWSLGEADEAFAQAAFTGVERSPLAAKEVTR